MKMTLALIQPRLAAWHTIVRQADEIGRLGFSVCFSWAFFDRHVWQNHIDPVTFSTNLALDDYVDSVLSGGGDDASTDRPSYR